MTYGRIETWSALPAAGPLDQRSREKQDLDFKRFADKRKLSEHAKDVAAFANDLGGVLIVGGDCESDRTLLKYDGLKNQTAADVAEIYDRAAAACSPALTVDVVPLMGPDGLQVVAVNVDPFEGQLVASPWSSEGEAVPSAWRFPVRRGAQTDFVDPQELPLSMNIQARTAFILLSSIPLSARREVHFYSREYDFMNRRYRTAAGRKFTLETLHRSRNFVELVSGNHRCRVPLSHVLHIWQETEDQWAVIVSGEIRVVGNGSLSYLPQF